MQNVPSSLVPGSFWLHQLENKNKKRQIIRRVYMHLDYRNRYVAFVEFVDLNGYKVSMEVSVFIKWFNPCIIDEV